MKKYLIAGIAIIIILISGFIYYNQSHISIWGFTVSKDKLKDVLIDTKDSGYMVTDSKLVLELSNEISKMKRLNKIQFNNFPPAEHNSEKYTKIMVQDVNNITYGGSFWDEGNNIIMDSNGYYWEVPKDLFDLMDKSIKDANKLN